MKYGEIVSLRELYERCEELPYADLSLAIHTKEINGPVQIAHCTHEQMLSIPNMAKSMWKYSATTHEGISLFVFRGYNFEATALFDYEPWSETHNDMWITPKGFPRQRYQSEYSS